MKKIMASFCLLVFCVSALSAPSLQGKSLVQTEWTLVELNGKAGIEAPKTPKLRFETKKKMISGDSGCNGFFGTYKLDGAKLSFSKMGAKMMACQTGMDVEQEFLKALNAVKTYKITDGKLELYGSDGKIAVFMASKSLVDTEWNLTELNGKTGLEATKPPSMRLDSKRKAVAGQGGCNRFFGSYALEGENLTFSKLGATKMMCSKGAEVETEFLKALESTKTFKLNGDQLELYDGNVKVAVFTSK